MESTAESVTLFACTFSGNSAMQKGGALTTSGVLMLTINASAFSSNFAGAVRLLLMLGTHFMQCLAHS